MKKISVIVPVYNAEKWLEKCIDSLLEQTFPNLEILLLDDESSDKSAEICVRYAHREPSVRFFPSTGHEGVSASRNRGLAEALGEYILFADADDFLPSKNSISLLYQKAEKEKADITEGNYCRELQGKICDAVRHDLNREDDRESQDFRFRGFFSNGILSYVWAKLYRADFLRKNQITFEPLDYAEDKLFNFQCYEKNASYAFLSENVYCYRKNPDSNSNGYHKDFNKTWMKIAQNFSEQLHRDGREDYGDLTALTIAFAIFFSAKQEYEYRGKSTAVIRSVIAQYNQDPLTHSELKKIADGQYCSKIHSPFWKYGLRLFCRFTVNKWYFPLAAGIRMLIDGKADRALSSTGKSAEKLG